MKLGNSGKCPDDVLADICHLPVKSHLKSHSHVICRSSARHPQVICTSSTHRPPRLQSPKYVQLNTRATALLKTGSLCYQKWTCPIKKQLSLRPREIPESIILRVLTFFACFILFTWMTQVLSHFCAAFKLIEK